MSFFQIPNIPSRLNRNISTYRMTFQFLEMAARHLKFALKKHYNRNVDHIPPFNSIAAAGGGNYTVSSGVASKFGSLSVSTHGMSKSTHGVDGKQLAEQERSILPPHPHFTSTITVTSNKTNKISSCSFSSSGLLPAPRSIPNSDAQHLRSKTKFVSWYNRRGK